VKAGKDKDGNIYIIDLDYDWLEFPDLMRWMVSNGGPHYIEDKASGKSAKQSLQDNGIYAQLVSVEGDKVARSKLASPLVERGDVYVNKRIIDTLLSDPNQGILDFPNGRGDDVNDAFVQALNRLGDLGEKEKKQTIGGFNIGGMF
jgi:predicted phage terminase large subunit-like protein